METDTLKPSLFSTSTDSFRPRFPRTSNITLFERPFSALAKHRVHELSDIREVSGSSKGGTVGKKKSRKSALTTDGTSGASGKASLFRPRLKRTNESVSSEHTTPAADQPAGLATPPRGLGSRAPSALSLPLTEVPPRRSSASFIGGQSASGSQNVNISDFPSWKLPGPAQAGQIVPPRGTSNSPVRAASRKDAVTAELLRPSASRTFIRTSPPLDIIENGSIRHPRVDMTARLPSPLFVGGGTIEGQIALKVDVNPANKSKSKLIYISKLSIDIIGVEHVNDGRRWIFLSLATELFDQAHPPPPSLVSSQESISNTEQLWPLKPRSSAAIPFCINLPLNIGPPPYISRQAGIRYLFCPTATVKVGDKQSIVRQTWNIHMLTVHDPEKALASLPDPLLASDTLSLTNNGQIETCKLTAGLHRQTWVNGAAIFIDIHISNNTSKSVKKIDLQVEKSTLWYSHAAAGTIEKSASHLRLPKKTDNEVAASSTMRKSREWDGILPHTSEVRTCNIDVPRGHVTISTGRYFEVRYFLSVTVTVGMFKTIAVQMPITLIHMNSLDILPNSLAQVANAIEMKRARTVPVSEAALLYPRYYQGQAFTAPRRQSLDQLRNGRSSVGNEIDALAYDLENSPRKFRHHPSSHHQNRKTATGINTSLSNFENLAPEGRSVLVTLPHSCATHTSSNSCNLLCADLGQRMSSVSVPSGPTLPRLQLSTSGLGFSDSEFEIDPDSPPRKVMLSESERRMINQQRELQLQRETSQKDSRIRRSTRASGDGETEMEGTSEILQERPYCGWKNVAASPNANPKLPEYGNWSKFSPIDGITSSNRRKIGGYVSLDRDDCNNASTMFKKKTEYEATDEKAPARVRSKTNPESMDMRPAARPSRQRRIARSEERRSGASMLRMSVDGPGLGIERMERRRSRSGTSRR